MPDALNKGAAKAVWGANPAGYTFGDGAEVGSKEFFERVLERRTRYEQPWLAELVPFGTARGRRVLELGCGAGYDAYEFLRHGANYTGIDLTPENIERTKRHLSYYGYTPAVFEGDAEELAFESESFDWVYSNGVLHHTPDVRKSFCEAYRVLVPGGRFDVVLYHKSSVEYWVKNFLINHILKLRFLRQPFERTIARVESTGSDALPIVNAYTRRAVAALLEEAGFSCEGTAVRKFVAEDMPAARLLGPVWRSLPTPLLEWIGDRWGWYVIARGVKA